MGLSISEFDRLTPAETQAELDEARERERERERARQSEKKFLAELIDEHLATLEMIVYNANYRHTLKLTDFKRIADPKKKMSAELLAFDARLRAKAQAKFKRN